jgi:hypothetical protein
MSSKTWSFLSGDALNEIAKEGCRQASKQTPKAETMSRRIKNEDMTQ